MRFWQRKPKSTAEERQAAAEERIKNLTQEALERGQRLEEKITQKMAELEKSRRDNDDMRNGVWPGGTDDSAGKSRVF